MLNTLEAGINTFRFLNKHISIKGMIGLSERTPGDKISGYVHIKDICKDCNIEFIEVESYTLNKKTDKEKIKNYPIDILIIGGWQRLIPGWLIDHCKVCAIGAHGSASGITKGRGRSPQNWALILGKKEFYISIFKIDQGVDSGDIIDTERFELSDFDDIKTSYYKVSLTVAQMIIRNIKNKNIFNNNFLKQSEKGVAYLPQRLPEDGEIDWNRNSNEIYNFIRALSKPYPGAYSYINNSIIRIWKGRPFNVTYEGNYTNGEVVAKLFNNDIIIKTEGSFFLIEDYSIDNVVIKSGDILKSGNFKGQIQNIIARHKEKYPEYPIAQELESICR